MGASDVLDEALAGLATGLLVLLLVAEYMLKLFISEIKGKINSWMELSIELGRLIPRV